jgi:hypothetical protein
MVLNAGQVKSRRAAPDEPAGGGASPGLDRDEGRRYTGLQGVAPALLAG